MNTYYTTYKMVVPFVPIKVILEKAKNLKTDMVIIPQIPCGIFPNKLIGVSANSIITIGDFKDLSFTFNPDFKPYPLWEDNDLKNIQLYLKDVNPFLKIISDYSESEARKENNIKDPKTKLPKGLADAYLPKECYIIGHKYNIGSVANLLNVYDKDGNIMTNTLGNNSVTNSFINLYNFGLENIISKMSYMINNSNCIVKNLDITEDPILLNIMNSKATDGSRIWIPNGDKNLNKYTTYINKAFLNISKGDNVSISIYDDIPKMGNKYYIMSFDIDKPKKGIHLNTTFAAFKLVD